MGASRPIRARAQLPDGAYLLTEVEGVQVESVGPTTVWRLEGRIMGRGRPK